MGGCRMDKVPHTAGRCAGRQVGAAQQDAGRAAQQQDATEAHGVLLIFVAVQHLYPLIAKLMRLCPDQLCTAVTRLKLAEAAEFQ